MIKWVFECGLFRRRDHEEMGNLITLKFDNQQEIRLKMLAKISLGSLHLAFEKYLAQFGYKNILLTYREFSKLFSHSLKQDELQTLFQLFVCDINDETVVYDTFGDEMEKLDQISIFETLGTFLFLCDVKVVDTR